MKPLYEDHMVVTDDGYTQFIYCGGRYGPDVRYYILAREYLGAVIGLGSDHWKGIETLREVDIP
jgi:hypothetical protein